MTPPRRPAAKSKSSPITVIRPDPAVWRQALALAEGDTRRLTVSADGTVLVRNAPAR